MTQIDSAARHGSVHSKVTWLADGILIMTAAVWGMNIIVFKLATNSDGALGFNALRLILAAMTLLFLAAGEALIWPDKRPRGPIPWGRVLVFSFLNGFMYLLLFVKGVHLTTAANVSLILASLPMWTALLSMLLLRERLPSVTWLGLLVTFFGTVIVITQSGRGISLGIDHLAGNLIILVATISWGGAAIVSRPIMQTLTPLQLAAISSTLTTPIHVAIANQGLFLAWNQATRQWGYLGAVLFSGVLSTGIAYASWNAGVRMVGASHAAVFQNVVTLVAVLGGWLLLAEPLAWLQIMGGLLTIAGLFLMRRGR